MWYWRYENFVGLRKIVSRLTDEPALVLFRDYCSLRERGLRRQAFAILEDFIATAESWDTQERREFVRWLIEAHDASPHVTDLLPHQLRSKLMLPTITQWQTELPDDPVPFRLAGDYESLKRAVLLDTTHEETVLRLVKLLWTEVGVACHELPAGVIGDTDVVLADLDEIERLLVLVPNPNEQNMSVAKFREVVGNYATYLNDKCRTQCFADWAKLRDLKCIVS